MSGAFEYLTTDLVDDRPLDPKTGIYTAPLPILSFEVTIGSYLAVGDIGSADGYVEILDDADSTVPPIDMVVFRTGATGAPINGLDPRYIQFGIFSFDLSRISGDDVPTGGELRRFRPADFPLSTINFLKLDGSASDRVDWQLTSFKVIPEPNTAALVLLGVIALAGSRRSARQSPRAGSRARS